jgi:hypothetical protein
MNAYNFTPNSLKSSIFSNSAFKAQIFLRTDQIKIGMQVAKFMSMDILYRFTVLIKNNHLIDKI